MTPEENSMKRFEEICEADGEALAKHYEEKLDTDNILEMAQEETWIRTHIL